MKNSPFNPGDIVRRIGETHVGKVIDVRDGYATVDFAQNGKITTGYLPVKALEKAPIREAPQSRPQDRV